MVPFLAFLKSVIEIVNIAMDMIHLSWIAFNLTGWIWERTLRIHLLTLIITFVSWVGLGWIYGWGYCFWTDWHWTIKRMAGEEDLPLSAITYYLRWFIDSPINQMFVNGFTVGITAMVLIVSIVQNIHKSRRSSVNK